MAFESASRGTPQFRLPTCRRLLHPRRRGVLDLTRQLGVCSLPPLFRRAVPSRCKGDTIVVSTANCAPSKMVNPSTTISNRLASTGLPPSMSRFLTMTFLDTRQPPFLHTCAPASANPLDPKTPASAHADGGHSCRGDGHREGNGKVETPAQQHSERLRVDASRTRRGEKPSRHCWQEAPHNARSEFVNLAQTILATPSWQARGASFCQPCLGSTGLSSSSFCPGRKPATTASHVGTSSCASRNVFPHSRTAFETQCFVVGEEALTIASATSGCLRFTFGMQSAQLAQCAASFLPAVKQEPKPPQFQQLFASSESPAMPTNRQKHRHTATS